MIDLNLISSHPETPFPTDRRMAIFAKGRQSRPTDRRMAIFAKGRQSRPTDRRMAIFAKGRQSRPTENLNFRMQNN
jgi:hypothetical protein